MFTLPRPGMETKFWSLPNAGFIVLRDANWSVKYAEFRFCAIAELPAASIATASIFFILRLVIIRFCV